MAAVARGAPERRARATANEVLHRPTMRLRADPPDSSDVVEAALRAVDEALVELVMMTAVS